jgi:hypothetical protein
MSSPPELALLHPRRSSPPAMSSPPRLPCWTPASSALLDHRRLRPASPAPALPCLPRAAMAPVNSGGGERARGGRMRGGRARQPTRGGALGLIGARPGPATLGRCGRAPSAAMVRGGRALAAAMVRGG